MKRFLELNSLDQKSWETLEDHKDQIEQWLIIGRWECFKHKSRPASRHRISKVEKYLKTLKEKL